MEDTDIKLNETYDIIFKQIEKLTKDGVDPVIIAGTLLAQALRLYRTVLTEPDFERMMDTVFCKLEEIKPYGPTNKTLLH
jgi:DNA polymerase III delta subunit